MGNKRRLRWIAGAFGAVVALFIAVAFYLDYNSTDAKIERAVAQIVEEYGFESRDQMYTNGSWQQIPASDAFYQREPLDADSAEEIVEILRAACPDWEHKQTFFDKEHYPVTTSDGDPWRELHTFRLSAEDGDWISSIAFGPNERGLTNPESEPKAFLALYRNDRLSLWERIKGMWPW